MSIPFLSMDVIAFVSFIEDIEIMNVIVMQVKLDILIVLKAMLVKARTYCILTKFPSTISRVGGTTAQQKGNSTNEPSSCGVLLLCAL